MLGFDNFLELERERLYECIVWDHTFRLLQVPKHLRGERGSAEKKLTEF